VTGLPEWFEEDRWVPPPGTIEKRRVWAFMQSLGFDDYYEFLAFSVDQPEAFYAAAMTDLGLDWPTPWHQLKDSSDGEAWTRWFVGGHTNMTWLAVHRWAATSHGARTALQWQGEDGEEVHLTYGELAEKIDLVTAGLRAAGVRDGDVVGMYLPPLPEAAILMFAVARMGAVLAPAFSGYGADALAERLQLVDAKFLITADGYLRRGQPVDMKSVANAAADAAGVERLIVVPRLGAEVAERPGDVTWNELLQHGREESFVWFEPEKPWLVAFTSGSTGKPKGAVHSHGRLPYRASIDMAYCLDMSEDSCLYWPSDMGWIIAPLGIVTSLILGGRHFIYEGAPVHPTPDVLWKLVEKHRVTHLGSSPTLLRQLAAEGAEWVEPYDLPTLQVIASAGEPMTKAAWRWMHRHVGRGIRPIMNHTGGTEIGCGLLSGSPVVPMRETRFAGPPPGIAVGVVDPDGRKVVGQLGELAVLQPWPSMTYGFWGEPQRWTDTYTSRFPGLYLHGDRAIEHEDGSWELPGRSDDLLKVGGKRIGPSEYEALALGVEGVVTAAAIGVPDSLKGEAVVVLFTAQADADAAQLATRIQRRVEEGLGKAFRASHVVPIDQLPLTRSAKVHRRAIRAWLTDTPAGDLSNLENPSSEESVRLAAESLLRTADEADNPRGGAAQTPDDGADTPRTTLTERAP
jgi:acetyl-CoA synthetase